MESWRQILGTALQQSALWRLVALGALVLLLLIPVAWIRDLIGERMVRRNEAMEEVSAKWGLEQVITGPVLIVPYVTPVENAGSARFAERTETRHLTILPEELRVRARIDGESRYRGIFAVPVYRVILDVSGSFAAPDLAPMDIDASAVAWARSQIALGIADTRAIQNRAILSWGDEQYPFGPGPGCFDGAKSGVHAGVNGAWQGTKVSFSFQLKLNGSSGLYFTPTANETLVEVESNWPNPSFQGNWLPGERSVTRKGFTAKWQIPFLGLDQPQLWTSSMKTPDLSASRFGVDLITMVDEHRMAERSVKYAHLFLVLTFATIWLIEVLAGARVHPVQYLLIGAALSTFYLLELSLAEQCGFAIAYVTASSAVAGLIGAYAVTALHGWSRAAGVTVVISTLYLYLYVVLTNEDYALLLGSVGVFLAVAFTMLLTRRVDWYALGGDTVGADQPT